MATPSNSNSPGALYWAPRISLGALAIAFLIHLNHPASSFSLFSPSITPNAESVTTAKTYCYTSILTEAGSHKQADCFSISPDGKFTKVFNSAEDVLIVGDNDYKEDGGNNLVTMRGHVIPGIWDGHGHLIQYGEFLHSVDLFGAMSAEEVRTRVREYLKDAEKEGEGSDVGSKENWARGVGWDQMVLGEMPSAAMLESDPALKGKFIMLDRVDVHCTWVSQAILDLIPPESLPEDVPGGEIIREPGMGVFCDNAMDIVTSLWPRPDAERKKTFLKSAMKELHKVGLVGMNDAGVTPTDLKVFEEASRNEDWWTLRVYAMIECGERNVFCPLKADAVKTIHEDGMLTIRSVKLFADGALGSWGSAMIDPYSDKPSTRGSLLVNGSTLESLARSWSNAGYQVNIHAIGDLANRYAIDALEAALRDACPKGTSLKDCQNQSHRFRIEHSQIIHPTDQARIRDLGIILSIQPTHATSDMAYAESRLGPNRTATEAYRMRSLIHDLQVQPVLGSDFPVEPPNPFEGMYAAVTRKNPHTGKNADGGDEGWYTEEALSLDEALSGFTKGVAGGMFTEGKTGVIREGAFADWVVLDEPLVLAALDNGEGLRKIKVRETWVGGRKVYDREEEKQKKAAAAGGKEGVSEDL
ncbi:amidohydrolase family-domain-containing protein [Pseudoneurospora amorphoporcata]|uniref:Amidohydrolase family-domain-containing protein n=1 Tax=Pseudoneurospora amorphoporcata TaxID=241081 RepID=A0AAN6SI36_9PEZI|nr:amidohydrolase family-domain-containing protein [Pseudoneurospora amorphoporcata]